MGNDKDDMGHVTTAVILLAGAMIVFHAVDSWWKELLDDARWKAPWAP